VATLVEVTRGPRIESHHAGEVVVADATGRVLASTGAPETFAYFRSAAKPFQALPLVASGAADTFGFGDDALAMACASHNATPQQQQLVVAMLQASGLGEADLRCGHAPPADAHEAARLTLGLVRPDQVQCECSGEHAGMLAVCVHRGYPLASYVAPTHPLQQEILALIGAVLQLPTSDIVVATDGCSLPTFGAPLRAFATAYALLANPQAAPTEATAPLAAPLTRLRDAMLAHPALIAGEGVVDTDLMRLTGGRLVAKLGAEGLLCLAVPARGWGIAIKSFDGLPRGLGAAAIGTLEQLDLLDAPTRERLRAAHLAPIRSFRGEPVGELRPTVRLTPPAQG
jgi:L-asparaginase II